MRDLNPDASALFRSSRTAFLPSASARERVLRSLTRRLGGDAFLDEPRTAGRADPRPAAEAAPLGERFSRHRAQTHPEIEDRFQRSCPDLSEVNSDGTCPEIQRRLIDQAEEDNAVTSLKARMSEEVFVRAACEGDPRATLLIFSRYQREVRATLLRLGGAHDLEDRVQEVFSRLFIALPRLRQAESLRSFLGQIVYHVNGLALRSRRRRRVELTTTGDAPELVVYPHDPLTAREAVSRFADILDRLGLHGRRAFVLRHVQELDLVDVAAAMNVSLSTAKRILAKARLRVLAMAERDPVLTDLLARVRHAAFASACSPKPRPSSQRSHT